MPINFIINITDVEDALTLSQSQFLDAVFSHAKEVVGEGGKIILQREYTYINSGPEVKTDLLAVFSTSEEIDNWKSRIESIKKQLGK
jgi:hypothetical protein